MRIVRDLPALTRRLPPAEREAAAAFGDGTVFVERYRRRRPAHRDPGLRRSARQHRLVVRTRLHRAAPPSEDHRGVTFPCCRRVVARRDEPSSDRRGTGRRLRRRRHRRVPGRRRGQLLVPRDEHPVAGRASRHGDDHRPRSRRVAVGGRRRANPFPRPHCIPASIGHAVEVRLCTEDPDNGYLPSSGTFRRIEFPEIEGVRVDSGVASGSVVSPFYDSMIAKVIAHAPTRDGAINKLQRALQPGTADRADHQSIAAARAPAGAGRSLAADRHRLARPQPARPARHRTGVRRRGSTGVGVDLSERH